MVSVDVLHFGVDAEVQSLYSLAMEIGSRIRRWREAKGLSKTQLASLVGVTVSAVVQWEHGHTGPNRKNLRALTDALGMSLAEFYGALPAPTRKAG